MMNPIDQLSAHLAIVQSRLEAVERALSLAGGLGAEVAEARFIAARQAIDFEAAAGGRHTVEATRHRRRLVGMLREAGWPTVKIARVIRVSDRSIYNLSE